MTKGFDEAGGANEIKPYPLWRFGVPANTDGASLFYGIAELTPFKGFVNL